MVSDRVSSGSRAALPAFVSPGGKHEQGGVEDTIVLKKTVSGKKHLPRFTTDAAPWAGATASTQAQPPDDLDRHSNSPTMSATPRLVTSIPIRFSNALEPDVHLHQFPMLSRSPQVPPSAAASGKRITSRAKPKAGRYEVHVPADTRPEVWNAERAVDMGAARAEEERDTGVGTAAADKGKGKAREEKEKERRLADVRLASSHAPERGTYMLAVVRDGAVHLHPISQTHQFRPSMTYLDVMSRGKRRARWAGGAAGSDDDSDEGPPPDPDDPAPPPPTTTKSKAAGEAREVQLSAKKATDDRANLQQLSGGMSSMRKEMLTKIRDEEGEQWEEWKYCDVGTAESTTALDGLLAKRDDELKCETSITSFYFNVSTSSNAPA